MEIFSEGSYVTYLKDNSSPLEYVEKLSIDNGNSLDQAIAIWVVSGDATTKPVFNVEALNRSRRPPIFVLSLLATPPIEGLS